jgi:hypothetical protein
MAHLLAELVELSLRTLPGGDAALRVTSTTRADRACVLTVDCPVAAGPGTEVAVAVIQGLAARLGLEVLLDPVPTVVVPAELVAPAEATILGS